MGIRLLVFVLLLSSCSRDLLVPIYKCEASEEICNGRDDDCDGLIDEYITRPCETVCQSGSQRCVSGEWGECNARLPSEERCNGKDDDCDGQTDEDLPIEPCYPRDQKELLYGSCRFGVKKCTSGIQECHNWVGPRGEVCNGIDDDCDGATDEGIRPDVDIVFAVDYSGSMMYQMSNLITILASWANAQNTPEVHYALIGVPAPSLDPDYVKLMINFTDNATFASTIDGYRMADGNGAEAQLDAIYMVAVTQNPLGLTWRPGAAKILVVFTDESPQSYFMPELTDSVAKAASDTAQLNTYIFTSSIYWNMNIWDITPLNVDSTISIKLDDIMRVKVCR